MRGDRPTCKDAGWSDTCPGGPEFFWLPRTAVDKKFAFSIEPLQIPQVCFVIGVPRQGSGNVLSRNFLRMHLRTGHSGAVGQQNISWKSGASFSFLETPRRAPQSLTRWSSYLQPWFSNLFPKGMTRAFALRWRQTNALSCRKCAGGLQGGATRGAGWLGGALTQRSRVLFAQPLRMRWSPRTMFATNHCGRCSHHPHPSHCSKLAEREAEREAESDAELEAERLAELEERLLQVCKCKAIL